MNTIDSTMDKFPHLCVIIPAYKVKKQIMWVINNIDSYITRIYIIDDCCPDRSGEFVTAECTDERVVVIQHANNLGVGGAVMSGYKQAIADGMDIAIKIDGDGQMDPRLIPDLIAPIIAGNADYTKGNRFFDLESLSSMPRIRLLGNAVLSFMNKLSSGYWDVFDPTNGFTAIHCEVLKNLPFEKISKRYFFESDMLFRLNILRATVIDVPMDAKYDDEDSNLSIKKVLGEFFYKNFRNTLKRIFYNYYLRGLSIASIELPLGIMMFIFGVLFGADSWFDSYNEGVTASPGTVMLASLPIILGVQLILAFFSYDIRSVPGEAFHVSKLRIKKFNKLIGNNDAR
ncbi:glycosyltransferase family 2 protein [Kosakonia sacchari]|uniref:Glycosyltransferase family 2 protein n=1 Tax=Kosakonia sacchari TaxID=1158459 RepID=A0ABZ0MWD0_9ENTR|nr:glycosyltransferase family 2 protein [Kosakonia sacchari]WOZ79004.1 glycosyltransferase family 2 protein [Kosakonia sacchari]